MKMKRVVLFGAGAMACLFAARLARVAQVAIIDEWPEAIAAIRKRGIRLEELARRSTIPVEFRFFGRAG